MPTTYRDIPGHPGYRVGDDGSVLSAWERYYTPGVSGSAFRVGTAWRPLRPILNNHGRLMVNLGRGKIRSIHRLVLLSFVGPCPPGLECCHEDGNPANNRLTNLRWDSHSGNQLDAVRHGTHVNTRGGRNGNASVSDATADQIRVEYAAGGTTYPKLAAKHGVSLRTISRIVKRRTFAHVGG